MKPIIITALMLVFSTAIFADKEKEEVEARVYCKASMTRLRKGTKADPGLNKAIYSNVPKKYSGWKVTYPKSIATKEPLKFEVEKAGVVTVISAAQFNHYLKENGWTEVDKATVETKKFKYRVLIFEKRLAVGKYELEADGGIYGPPRLLKR